MTNSTADAIENALISPNVLDANMEPVNVVDALGYLAKATNRVAIAITDDVAAGPNAFGGTASCLTEAIMGITQGLASIANAISDLADATREAKENQ